MLVPNNIHPMNDLKTQGRPFDVVESITFLQPVDLSWMISMIKHRLPRTSIRSLHAHRDLLTRLKLITINTNQGHTITLNDAIVSIRIVKGKR
jgi:hypothetical protein